MKIRWIVMFMALAVIPGLLLAGAPAVAQPLKPFFLAFESDQDLTAASAVNGKVQVVARRTPSTPVSASPSISPTCR